MSADDWRIYVTGFASPILLLSVVVLAMAFREWVTRKVRRWKFNRHDAIYRRGYEAGKQDCEENR